MKYTAPVRAYLASLPRVVILGGAAGVIVLGGAGTALTVTHDSNSAAESANIQPTTAKADKTTTESTKTDTASAAMAPTSTPASQPTAPGAGSPSKPSANTAAPKKPGGTTGATTPSNNPTPQTPTPTGPDGKLVLSSYNVSVHRGTTLRDAITASADDGSPIFPVAQPYIYQPGGTRIYAYYSHPTPSTRNTGQRYDSWPVTVGSFDNVGTYPIVLEATNGARKYTATLTVYVYQNSPVL